ncbi:MAG: EamA family transporter [Acidimicrobiales bacterium]
MAAILALGASLLWGTADFSGGVASRRTSSLAVLLVATPVGLAGLVVGALVQGGHPTLGALGWGALAGLTGGAGVLAFYRGLATGSMSVVAPVSATVGAVVPVVAGLAIGNRPGAIALLGIGLCLVAIAMLGAGGGAGAAGPGAGRRAFALAVASGVGFGLFLVLLKPVDPGSGLWPLVTSTVASWLVVGAAALASGLARPVVADGAAPAHRVRASVTWLPAVAGLLNAASEVLYLRALQHGLLVSVAILASLYPAVTVLLARVLLAERLHRLQQLAVVVAVAGVVLVALP